MRSSNLILVDVKCANVTGISENCAITNSFLKYKCRKGFKFTTLQSILLKFKLFLQISIERKILETFKSTCTRHGWTDVPYCIPSI